MSQKNKSSGLLENPKKTTIKLTVLEISMLWQDIFNPLNTTKCNHNISISGCLRPTIHYHYQRNISKDFLKILEANDSEFIENIEKCLVETVRIY